MTYKPESVKGSFGLYGQVKIIAIENGKVKFMFREQDKTGNFGETLKLKVKVEDCLPVAKVGTWAAQLSSNKDKLYQVRPINGVFPGKFVEFVAKKDQPPSPTMSSGKPEFQHLIFRPLFILTRDDVAGMRVGYRWGLDYSFVAGADDFVKYGKQLDRSVHMQEVDEFLTLTGVWDKGAMNYNDNLLPFFQRRALEANKTLLIHVENGYIKALIPDMSNETFEENNL